MPIYETLTILHPELAEARVKEVLTWMQDIVQNGQGNVLQVDEWGMRNLAYEIQKQGRGYYVRLEYEAEPAALKELERNFRLSEDVIRFMSIVRDAPSEKRPAAPAPAPEVASAAAAAPKESAESADSAQPAASTEHAAQPEAGSAAPVESAAAATEAPADEATEAPQAAPTADSEPAAASADEQS